MDFLLCCGFLLRKCKLLYSPYFVVFFFSFNSVIVSRWLSFLWEIFQKVISPCQLRGSVSKENLQGCWPGTPWHGQPSSVLLLHSPKTANCPWIYLEHSFRGVLLSKYEEENGKSTGMPPVILLKLSLRCFRSKGFASLMVAFLLLGLISSQRMLLVQWCLQTQGAEGVISVIQHTEKQACTEIKNRTNFT